MHDHREVPAVHQPRDKSRLEQDHEPQDDGRCAQTGIKSFVRIKD